jgi:cell division septation protein DedD
MPLNIQDSDEEKKPAPARPKATIIPPEPESTGRWRGMLLWIFLLVAAVSAIFLLIQFGVIPFGGGHRDTTVASKESPAPPPADTSHPVAAIPPAPPPSTGDGARPEKDRAAELRSRLAKLEGQYTIFISAFHDAGDAEELAGRWEKAGYPAFVQHSGSWYRVALGRYVTAAIAKVEAEKLRQAFEEPYWIGRAEF